MVDRQVVLSCGEGVRASTGVCHDIPAFRRYRGTVVIGSDSFAAMDAMLVT
ncbi:hypothetical protein AB0950_39265 [Streptomyces sp. NPDC007189]|uniref:hypothetical protein n=1 Tax=Streptomyces sp. NPDC007189 TaxID=3154315 RepID=UPI00345139F0